MEHQEFLDMLARGGFAAPVEVDRAPDGRLDEHSHPFEARALILEGEIHITVDGVQCIYLPGDVFHLAAGQPHSERYGPQGVRYLSGRR